MYQQTVQCRACQRAFLVSTQDPVQLDVRCPLCGLTLVYPDPRAPGAHPPDSIVAWDAAECSGG
jgi:DNA-directed RNA polymerase subunit RPC12/RpoP